MESLASFLGVRDPAMPDAPEPRAFDANISIRDFCKGVLRSAEYRASIVQRIRLGTLPPAVEIAMYHYAEGKPVERVEMNDLTPRGELRDMTPAELEARAMTLCEMARRVRMQAEDARPETPGSVH